MNQEVQAYMRAYIDYAQQDWSHWLPAAQLAIVTAAVAERRAPPAALGSAA
jgi:hypothetical protein